MATEESTKSTQLYDKKYLTRTDPPRSLRPMPVTGPVPVPDPEPPETVALHDRAMDNLRFIRKTMEGAALFTAVSGGGAILVGIVALTAAALAGTRETVSGWLAVWLGAALVAAPVMIGAILRKARRSGESLWSRPGRRFALGLTPPLAAGAILTQVLWAAGAVALLPGLWLLLYGTAVITGGAFSVRIVPVTGLCFMLLGGAALLSPAAWGDAYLAVGFGGLHLVSGWIIWRRHGG